MKTILLASLAAVTVFIPTARAEAQCCYGHYEAHYYSSAPPPPLPRVTYPSPPLPPPRWSVGLHLTGISTNQRIGGDGVALGGVGGHLRVRGYRWGGELAVDVVGNDLADGGLRRVSVPLQASALLYLLPSGRFNVFVLGGVRLVPTRIDYDLPNLSDHQTFTEFGGQGGIGAELLLSRYLSLTADLRGFGTFRSDSDPAGIYYRDLGDEAVMPARSVGVQASFGASLRF